MPFTESASILLSLEDAATTSSASKPEASQSNVDGIYYKELIPYIVKVTIGNKSDIDNAMSSRHSEGGAKLQTAQAEPVNLPYTKNFVVYMPSSSVSYFHIERSTFVENKVVLNFTNGTPTNITLENPSEAKEIISLPFDLAGYILSIPSNILTLRIKNLKDESDYYKAQQSILDAKVGLINSAINYQKAITPNLNSQ